MNVYGPLEHSQSLLLIDAFLHLHLSGFEAQELRNVDVVFTSMNLCEGVFVGLQAGEVYRDCGVLLDRHE